MWVGARCPARRSRSAPRRSGLRQPRQAPTRTASTARSSTRRSRSSGSRSTTRRSRYTGKYFHFPPPGIPDRGGFVEDAHAGPAAAVPLRDLAGDHLAADPRARAGAGHGGVFWNKHHAFIKRCWERYGRGLGAVARRRRAGAGREADAGAQRADRGHPRAGARLGARRPRRVLEVPRAVRLESRATCR